MILLNWLGDDYPTFPQFVRMLRDYEKGTPQTAALPTPTAGPDQIEGYEKLWKQANTRNFPYLPLHPQQFPCANCGAKFTMAPGAMQCNECDCCYRLHTPAWQEVSQNQTLDIESVIR